jgi:hypothetical protein
MQSGLATGSQSNPAFLIIAVAVYTATVLAAIWLSPDWTATQTWAIALTGLVVIWYTWETMQLRLSAWAQRELELGHWLCLSPRETDLLPGILVVALPSTSRLSTS